jgi:hypothetical protein
VVTSPPRVRLSVPLLAGLALVGVYVVARALPESTSPGRLAREIEAKSQLVPVAIAQTRSELRRRLDDAIAAFHAARQESERVFTLQLEEAKKRGSLPPA